MSKVVTTTILPDVAGGSVTLGGTNDSVVVTGNDLRTNALQDAGGNAVFTSDGSGNLSGMNSGLSSGRILLRTQTASNSASIDFATNITSTYDIYIFTIINVKPATDTAYLQMNTSTNSGTAWGQTNMTTSFSASNRSEGGSGSFAYQSDRDEGNGQPVKITSECGGGADEGGSLVMTLYAPSSTTYVKQFQSQSQIYQSSNYAQTDYVGGYINTASAINGIQFYFTSGNISVGTFKLYGVSKS